MPHAPAAALVITDEERRELIQVVGLRCAPQSIALRVKMFSAPQMESQTRCWLGNSQRAFRRFCFGAGDFKRMDWQGFCLIFLAPVVRSRSLLSEKRR